MKQSHYDQIPAVKVTLMYIDPLAKVKTNELKEEHQGRKNCAWQY
jgi:hypothetical protein